MTAEEQTRLQELKEMDTDASTHKFKTAWRREEVRLRARARGCVSGPEDGLAERLDKKDGLGGKERWAEYLVRARRHDGDELHPKPEKIAREPVSAVAKARITWLNESSKARCCELLFVEELKPAFSHWWELNSRPQLDAGKNPLSPESQGRGMDWKPIHKVYCDRLYEFEMDESWLQDWRVDALQTTLAVSPEDKAGAQVPESIAVFAAGMEVTL